MKWDSLATAGAGILGTLTLIGCNTQTQSGYYEGKIVDTDEKTTVYALEQQIRAGATDAQLTHPFVHVVSKTKQQGADVVEYLATDAHGNSHALLVMGANADQGGSGQMIVPADKAHLQELEAINPTAKALNVGSTAIEQGWNAPKETGKLRELRQQATLDDSYNGNAVKVQLLSNDFDFVYDADAIHRTAKVGRARIAVLWQPGMDEPLSTHQPGTLYHQDANGNLVNPYTAPVPMSLHVFVGGGYKNLFPVREASPATLMLSASDDCRKAIKDYPRLLAEAKKTAGL